jgi:hypothetical protein
MRSKFLVHRLISVRSTVSVVKTCIWCMVEGIASWTDGEIPMVGCLVGRGASATMGEKRVTGLLM